MSTDTLPTSRLVIMPTDDAETESPVRLPCAYLSFKFDMCTAVQKLPQLTDEEVLAANQAVGGFAWLDDPKEDIYRD